jgi:hypothetical protein
MFRRLLALLLVCLVVAVGIAAPPAPLAPETYNVQLRYSIMAFRTERLRQYEEMLKAFKEVGFVRDPDEVIADDEPDNPNATRMQGRIPTKNVEALIRQRHVRSLLLYPKDSKLPAKDARVRVDMQLPGGFLPEAQRLLSTQTSEALRKDAGFIPAVGYDHRGFTRLVGSMPAGQLDKVLEDVRKLPHAKEMTGVIQSLSPVRITNVRPDWPVPTGRPKAVEVPEKQLKFAPELRTLLAGGDAGKQARMEVILGWTPAESEKGWQRSITQSGCVIEGRMGPIVTVTGIPKVVAPKLEEKNEIAHVRLPRSGKLNAVGSDKAPDFQPLRASGLGKLHAKGQKGKGTRIVVLGDDFAGWDKLKERDEAKSSSPTPKFVDLTAERNRDIQPDPMTGTGFGTRCARAVIAAAPEADVTLVRIDAHTPYMMQEVANAISGNAGRTITLEQRLTELRDERGYLDRRRNELADERAKIFENATNEESAKRLEAYRTRQTAFDRDYDLHLQKRARYFRLVDDLQKLKGTHIVASTLVWTEGYPVDGSSSLSRSFDDRPFKAALWFQAAGDTAGQAWAGEFEDADNNGIFEFSAKKELPAGSWSRELNFLRWQPTKGEATASLPGGARVRITLQWREAHDPLPLQAGQDVYRDSLSKFTLVAVQQLDPEGKTRPADDLNVVATSVGRPVRIDQQLNCATYEQIVELKIDKPGRYGLFVEGKLADSTQAPGEAGLPSTRKKGEVRPRLFVRTLEGEGRAVWGDYATGSATIGMPADSKVVVTVGAAGADNKARASSADGAPFGMALAHKPDVLAYDDGGGTAEAASFAAGFAASAWPTGGTLFGVLDRLQVRPGAVLRVPE